MLLQEHSTITTCGESLANLQSLYHRRRIHQDLLGDRAPCSSLTPLSLQGTETSVYRMQLKQFSRCYNVPKVLNSNLDPLLLLSAAIRHFLRDANRRTSLPVWEATGQICPVDPSASALSAVQTPWRRDPSTFDPTAQFKLCLLSPPAHWTLFHLSGASCVPCRHPQHKEQNPEVLQ